MSTVREDEDQARLEHHARIIFLAIGHQHVIGECLFDAVLQKRWDDARFYAREIHDASVVGLKIKQEAACLLIRLASK